MVGGGREGSTGVNQSTNLFAALRKQKKTSKNKAGSSKTTPAKEPEAPVFWAPSPLTVKSWADVDDEDDDDYYATTAPPQSVWSSSEPQHAEEKAIQESESDDDLLDEGDDDIEDDHDHDVEDIVPPETGVEKPVETVVVQKEPERQLSKKELKKKEDEEFEALLAGFTVAPKENGHGESDAANETSEGNKGEGEKKEGSTSESKTAKKKKKKEKSKEAKDSPKVPAVVEAAEDTGPGTEEDASSIDVKERLKKIASQKKKKSSKEMDGAAKAAAQEATARRAKLAAAKKKEKSHYNQQPIR